MLRMITAAAALTLAAGSAHAETVYLTAARMIDPVAGRAVENPAVVIVDDKVQSVGRQGQLQSPAGARRVDLAGKTILPGLIDMHVHLDSDPTYGGYTGLQFGDRFASMLTVPHAQRTLEAGFTTVRNVGADAWNDVGYRQAVEEGKIVGPRVVTAGYSFGATGGHCDSTYFPPSMQEASPYNINSPEDARRVVREVRKYGAQVIKICATGGVFSRNTEPGQQQLSLEEMQAVVKEAHQWGMQVAAHAHGTSGIKDAIRAGVDTIEHASIIDDEGIRLAKERGAFLSMDIYNTDYTQSEGKKNGVLEDNLRKDRDIAEVQRQGFARAHRAGARHVYGTDAGVYPHGQNGRQFATMVRYGMTPMQAIQAATVNSAEALGAQGALVGAIAPGKYADIIAVDGDPLRDVRELETVDFVMKGGAVVKGAPAQ